MGFGFIQGGQTCVEEFYNLLWYLVQHEGVEASPNIMSMGEAPNQQIAPALIIAPKKSAKNVPCSKRQFVPEEKGQNHKGAAFQAWFSFYVEEYVLMGGIDFFGIIEKNLLSKQDVILNGLNGDSNLAFFEELKKAGITSAKVPVMIFSIKKEEITKMDLVIIFRGITFR